MFGIIPFGTNEPMPRRRFPWVTATIVLINVAVFGYEFLLAGSGGLEALNDFINRYAVIPQQVLTHGWLDPTLITSQFLHGGLLHIASNMLFLMAFGDNVEDRLGHLPYLVYYLLWGIIGSAAHILLNPTSTLPALGASGAIAGVLGAYLMLFPRGMVRALFFFFIFFTFTRLPAAFMIGAWFIMQLFAGIGSLTPSAEVGGVAVWAHIGGFIAGAVTAFVVGRRSSEPEPEPGWP